MRTLHEASPLASLIALALGLWLRLFFLLKYPASSGDIPLYDEIATNWLKHGVYGMNLNDVLTPVDVRMPGYPAFLALMYALTGHTGEAAQFPPSCWRKPSWIFSAARDCAVTVWLVKIASGAPDSRPAFRAGILARRALPHHCQLQRGPSYGVACPFAPAQFPSIS